MQPILSSLFVVSLLVSAVSAFFHPVFVQNGLVLAKDKINSADFFLQPPYPPAPPRLDSPSIDVQADGSILAGGELFADFADYQQSDFFRENNKRCGTPPISALNVEAQRAALSDCSFTLTVIRDEYNSGFVLEIPVVFHIIYGSDGTGNLTNQQIYDQIAVLNEDFRALPGTLGAPGTDTMVQFRLVDITRTMNDNWFNDNDESGYKSTLGWDPDNYLNIYTNTASGYLGYSSFPQDSAGSVWDGVVVLYEVVGGRDNGAGIYDEGRTLTHELGHYFGLFHTFESYPNPPGCYTGYTLGDLINDTASENIDHYDCVQTTTCGTPDPITNYMNYTPDNCMNNFTPEQSNRLICSLVNYRPQLYEVLIPYTDHVFLPMLIR
ncbi:MAG: hypothetical protein CL609_07770 [Anaerolineaceae bacterium]|nr:hypothetical protein [Anaerolineaceae bacterium]